MKSRNDHGSGGGGECDAEFESLARGGLYVVVGPVTTQERRDGTHHDKRGQGRTSRQAHLSQESQWRGPAGREEPDDHGSGGGGTASFHDHGILFIVWVDRIP